MIARWAGYVGVAYRPSIQVPFMVSWAFGLTALFAGVSDDVRRWQLGSGLLVTAATLVLNMLVMRALDDLRDLDYDRAVNPTRPLPSGQVGEGDLLTLVAAGSALLLALNAGRGVVLAVLAAELAYTGTVVALDRFAGWPAPRRLWLQLALNLPIQTLFSCYVYAGFLRAEHLRPSAAGVVAILAVTAAGLSFELGRKTTRRPRAGERSYVSVLGPSGSSLAALAAAAAATATALVILTPWRPGSGWGWLVLLPLALPALAAAKFAGGAARWPLRETLAYIPAMYLSFFAVGWLTKGTIR